MGIEDENDTDDVPRRRGPGRPKGSGKRTVTTTRQEFVEPVSDEDENDDGPDDSPPLFDKAALRTDRGRVGKVRITRTSPDEGHLGYMDDPHAVTESSIKDLYGGGTFKIDALTDAGGYIRSITRKIAGDPIFQSAAAEITWRKSKGLPATVAAVATGKNEMGIGEILALLKTTEEAKTKEADDREARRRNEEREWKASQALAEREHQERMRKLDVEAETARRRDDEDRDRRRKQDEDERDQRRKRDQAEAEQRQQQFMAQTIAMLQQSSQQALQFVKASAAPQNPQSSTMDAIKTVLAIKEAFAGDGGGGDDKEETPLNLLIKHGGEWINGLSNGIGAAIREVKGGGAAAQQIAAPAAPGLALPPGNPLNDKVGTLVAKLAAKGYDPLASMDLIVDKVISDVDALPRKEQQAAPMPAPRPAPPVKPATQAPFVASGGAKVVRFSTKPA